MSLSLSWSTNSIVGEAAVGGEVVDAVSVVRWRDRSFMLRMQLAAQKGSRGGFTTGLGENGATGVTKLQNSGGLG